MMQLFDKPKEYCCRYLFDVFSKIPNNYTNFVESFNNVINFFMYKCAFNICEQIRNKWKKWITKTRNTFAKWQSKFMPTIKAQLDIFGRYGGI